MLPHARPIPSPTPSTAGPPGLVRRAVRGRPSGPLRRGGAVVAFVVAVVLAVSVSGCGSGPVSTGGPAAPAAGSGDPRNLRGVCPDRVVLQGSWLPQAELGWMHHLVGGGGRVDAARKSVSGPLVAGGPGGPVDTGVTVEVRSGGPAIGFQSVSAQMYADQTITLGATATDETVMLSATQPTLAVLAPLDGDPLSLLWDPVTHPRFNSISDIGQTDTTVVYYQSHTYMQYLIGAGILRQAQTDGSYDGTPARFVAARGALVTQGYATNERYVYEHEVRAWHRPVGYQLVQETGYPNYANTLVIRRGDRERLDGCLRRLVPIIQRAQVDFLTRPAATLASIVAVVAAYRTGYTYSPGNAEFAVQQLRELNLVGNGADHTLGDTDPGRVQRMIDILRPIAAGQRKPIPPGLAPADVATNDYLEPGIGLPT